MAQANASLPRNNPSFYIAGAAVTLALYRARQAVKDGLRRKGEKVSSVRACEITAMAKAYLAEHRELLVEARATVEQWTLDGAFGKRAQRELRANLFGKLPETEHSPKANSAKSGVIANV